MTQEKHTPGARHQFEMTQEQFDKILEACKPVPLIMLQCGMPRSPQENANDAWKALGDLMGFDSMSVEPVRGGNQRQFSAIAKATGGE